MGYGELVTDGERVRCELCGRWFLKLGNHLKKHGTTADSYREEFGLERHHGLMARGGVSHARARAAALGVPDFVAQQGKINAVPGLRRGGASPREETLRKLRGRQHTQSARQKMAAAQRRRMSDPDVRAHLSRLSTYNSRLKGQRARVCSCGAATRTVTRRCISCFKRQRHERAVQNYITAIRRWNEEHGAPPRQREWLNAGAAWPAASGARKLFGSWSAAIAAAGLTPRTRGGQRMESSR